MSGTKISTRIRVYAVCTVSVLLFSGCLHILFPSSGFYNVIYIEGYVFSSVDSSAVPGIQVSASHKDTVYAESDGFYSTRFSVQSEDYPEDFREWKVVAIDIDGNLNGSFIKSDSTLVEEVATPETNFHVDFYLERLESFPPGSL